MNVNEVCLYAFFFFFLNTGIPCQNSQDCDKRFLCVNDLNNKVCEVLAELADIHTCRKVLQLGCAAKAIATFCFCFSLMCFQIDMMTRFRCTKHRQREKDKQESRQTAWLPHCPATRLVLKQLHVAVYLPPSQMDLCHFGRCFSALIHCSNCFMLAHVGFTVKPPPLDHFIRVQFRCLCSPN